MSLFILYQLLEWKLDQDLYLEALSTERIARSHVCNEIKMVVHCKEAARKLGS